MCNDTMRHYESLAAESAEMLIAAQAGKWDQLIASQQRCAGIAALLQAEPISEFRPQHQEKRNRLIRTILANDARVRALTEPRLEDLQKMLHETRLRRNVDRSYG